MVNVVGQATNKGEKYYFLSNSKVCHLEIMRKQF